MGFGDFFGSIGSSLGSAATSVGSFFEDDIGGFIGDLFSDSDTATSIADTTAQTAGDVVSEGGGFFDGVSAKGVGSVLSGLAGVGAALLQNGVSEDKLELEKQKLDITQQNEAARLQLARDQIAAQKEIAEINAGIARKKLKIETALAAIEAAKEVYPDVTNELKARQARSQQNNFDTQNKLRALEGMVSGFQGAIK